MQHFQTSVHYPPNCSLFFILPLALRGCFHYARSRVRSTACVASKCHLQTPHHYISFHFFTSFPFCLWTSPLPPQYPVCQDYLYLKYAEMKVKALGLYFVIEVPRATRPEYQLLVFDARCRTPIAPLAPAVAAHLKLEKGPPRTAHSLGGYAYLAPVYHHFCQLSLLCKRALIFIGASPSLSAVLEHKVTRAQGIVLHRAAYDCRATLGFLVHISSPAPLYATLA